MLSISFSWKFWYFMCINIINAYTCVQCGKVRIFVILIDQVVCRFRNNTLKMLSICKLCFCFLIIKDFSCAHAICFAFMLDTHKNHSLTYASYFLIKLSEGIHHFKYHMSVLIYLIGMYTNQTGEPAVETKLLMKWMEKYRPTVTIVLRGGSQIITHPYYSKGQTGKLIMLSSISLLL